MARPYSGAAATHMFFGLLSMAAGIAWICLLYYYEPLFVQNENNEQVPLVTVLPAWVVVLLCAKIFCGFWFFVTGAVGCSIRSRGCSEGVFVGLNVLNVIIWAPLLLLMMATLIVVLLYLTNLLSAWGFDGADLSTLFSQYAWLWVFPGVGCLVGVVEFILSIVSYSVVCCCRPQSLNDGYEYQYEMK